MLCKIFKIKCLVQRGTVYVVFTVVFLCPRLFLLLVKVEKKVSAALYFILLSNAKSTERLSSVSRHVVVFIRLTEKLLCLNYLFVSTFSFLFI